MMWPPVYTLVIPRPVACLQPRARPSRKVRRSNRYGKQSVWDRLDGKMSPKQMREAGL